MENNHSVTKDNLENQIYKAIYQKIGNKTTICCLILKNGFEIIGYSSCVDYKNYNQEKGEKLAFDNAFNQLWLVEAYVMQNRKTYNQNQKNKNQNQNQTRKPILKK